ncbi:MAG: response regulator transcription factor [Elainellaceae cyanobacterium]
MNTSIVDDRSTLAQPFFQGQAPDIVVLSSDIAMGHLLRLELEKNQVTVHLIYDGISGFAQLRHQAPKLIILDSTLLGLSALEFCRYLRAHSYSTTLLVLTQQPQASDRVAALEAGADDCLSKPFEIQELRAKVQAHMRRIERLNDSHLQFRDILLDIPAREVRKNSQVIFLTAKEFDLLEYFMRHPKQVLTRTQILEQVWSNDFSGTSNIIEVYIRSLRRKLELPGSMRLIHTIRGVGYVLRE